MSIKKFGIANVVFRICAVLFAFEIINLFVLESSKGVLERKANIFPMFGLLLILPYILVSGLYIKKALKENDLSKMAIPHGVLAFGIMAVVAGFLSLIRVVKVNVLAIVVVAVLGAYIIGYLIFYKVKKDKIKEMTAHASNTFEMEWVAKEEYKMLVNILGISVVGAAAIDEFIYLEKLSDSLILIGIYMVMMFVATRVILKSIDKK